MLYQLEMKLILTRSSRAIAELSMSFEDPAKFNDVAYIPKLKQRCISKCDHSMPVPDAAAPKPEDEAGCPKPGEAA